MKLSQKRKCLGCKAEPDGTFKKTCKLGYEIKSELVDKFYFTRYFPIEPCYKPMNINDFIYLLNNKDIR